MPSLHRRNFFPTVIVNLFLWATCGLIVFFLSPERLVNIILFFFVLVLSLGLTFSLLLANTRRGFWLAIFIVSVLFVRFLL